MLLVVASLPAMWGNIVGRCITVGVHITAGHKFCCSLSNAKISFYRAFNCIFGKVGRVAHKNVVIELLKAKCLLSLYYGLEACPMNKSQIKSLNFVLNSAFRKIFVIKSHDDVNECIRFFNCSVSGAINKRKLNFLTKLQFSESTLCKPFAKILLMNWLLCVSICVICDWFICFVELCVFIVSFLVDYRHWWIKMIIILVVRCEIKQWNYFKIISK